MLLRDWKDINRVRAGRAQRTPATPSTPSQTQAPTYPGSQGEIDQMNIDMGRLALTGQEPPLPPKTPDYGYGRVPPTQSPPKDMRPDLRMQTQLPQSPGPYTPGTPSQAARPLPGGRPGYSGEPVQPGRATPTGYEPDGYYQVRFLPKTRALACADCVSFLSDLRRSHQ